ncbi:MAG: hypothetical protein HN929_09605 [Chloroflexi bacterium]|jgi:hypothetical protein|nr:hypothetical protein [Chloroflexota bacterium]MBT7081704.1 hypothetical protein [Chloroflexota bacterium]MBT7289147.1 hypothetical protein [Chloroflexota bacterium]
MKRKILVFILATAIAVTMTGCGAAAWEEYTSTDGSFSVQMPGTPVEETDSLDTVVGNIDIYAFSVENSDAAYAVVYSDYPQSMIDQSNVQDMLDDACSGAVEGAQGSMNSQTSITYSSYPGREINLTTSNDTIITQRMYVVGNRLYQLLIETEAGDASSSNVAKFLDSFELVQ